MRVQLRVLKRPLLYCPHWRFASVSPKGREIPSGHSCLRTINVPWSNELLRMRLHAGNRLLSHLIWPLWCDSCSQT